jgi:hypothetical protein
MALHPDHVEKALRDAGFVVYLAAQHPDDGTVMAILEGGIGHSRLVEARESVRNLDGVQDVRFAHSCESILIITAIP